MTAEPMSLSGRASAAHRAKQRRTVRAAKQVELRGDLGLPVDPATVRAWEAWLRETLPLRQAAAELAGSKIGALDDPDSWAVRPDSSNTAHASDGKLEFTAFPLLSLSGLGGGLHLGVRLAGSSAPLRTIDSIEALGAFLAEHAPKRAAK